MVILSRKVRLSRLRLQWCRSRLKLQNERQLCTACDIRCVLKSDFTKKLTTHQWIRQGSKTVLRPQCGLWLKTPEVYAIQEHLHFELPRVTTISMKLEGHWKGKDLFQWKSTIKWLKHYRYGVKAQPIMQSIIRINKNLVHWFRVGKLRLLINIFTFSLSSCFKIVKFEPKLETCKALE